MKYKYLGKTGLQVSQLCFGTMSFGGDASAEEAKKMFLYCLDKGINIFDCANSYNKGRAEKILGKLVKKNRNNVIITSKFSNPMSDDINNEGASRHHIIRAVEASLKRLNTDRVDILFFHRWPMNVPLEESLRGLEDLVRSGKVVYVGASNFSAWQVSKAVGIAALREWSKLEVIQPMYNLVKRQAEVEILPLAEEEQLGVISYSPLGGGLLSGKYSFKKKPINARLSTNPMYAKRYGDNWAFETAAKLNKLSLELSVHPATLAVSWVAANEKITAPIIGSRNLEQLKESLAAVNFKMTAEIYKRISSLSPTPPLATDRSEDQHLLLDCS